MSGVSWTQPISGISHVWEVVPWQRDGDLEVQEDGKEYDCDDDDDDDDDDDWCQFIDHNDSIRVTAVLVQEKDLIWSEVGPGREFPQIEDFFSKPRECWAGPYVAMMLVMKVEAYAKCVAIFGLYPEKQWDPFNITKGLSPRWARFIDLFFLFLGLEDVNSHMRVLEADSSKEYGMRFR